MNRCGRYSFGTVEFRRTVTVPRGAKDIEISGTELYTAVYIDEHLLAERIYAPFVFALDERYQGENAVVRIVQKSSISSIFGDAEYFKRHHKDIVWRTTPSSQICEFGFDEINWIF